MAPYRKSGQLGGLRPMTREHLEGRENWQNEANRRGQIAELDFGEVMRQHLTGTDFTVDDRPRDLASIYGRGQESSRAGGIRPDHAICNATTGKAIYVEVKRQRAAGNAHERACKYMMPGILRSARQHAGQPEDVIPIWWIFTNGIATDGRYEREIMHWFLGIERHVLLWQNRSVPSYVTDHFDKHICQLLL